MNDDSDGLNGRADEAFRCISEPTRLNGVAERVAEQSRRIDLLKRVASNGPVSN